MILVSHCMYNSWEWWQQGQLVHNDCYVEYNQSVSMCMSVYCEYNGEDWPSYNVLYAS